MLKEKIQEDLKTALKSGEALRRLVLSGLLSVIKTKELEKRSRLSKTISDQSELEKQSQLMDEEIEPIIASETKKRKESIEQFKNAGRQDLADKEEKELKILLGYLPEPAAESEVVQIVDEIIEELGAKDISDMGKIIGAVRGKLKNRADGQLISRIVKEKLSL